MRLRNFLLAGMALAAAPAISAPALAQASQSEIQAMKKQIDALQKRVRNMEAKTSGQIKEIKAKQDEAVELSYENGRPALRSPDGNFEMALRGRMHFDMAGYRQDGSDLPVIAPGRDLNEGGNFRRAELGMEGRFMRDWEYHVSYNFGASGTEGGGNIKNMYLGYTGITPLRIQIGAIQAPMTLDDSTSSNEITFIERASPSALATSFGAQTGRTAAGLRGNTSNFFGALFYTRDPLTAAGSAALPDESSNLVGRVAYLYAPNPDTNVHFGASATKVLEFTQAAAAIPQPLTGTFNLQDRPELRVDGTRLVSSTALPAEDALVFGPEFGANWKNFYLQGEYYRYEVDRAPANVAGAVEPPTYKTDGWYVQGSWIVTGETKRYDIKNASFGAPRPSGPFGFGESPGAIELAARYSTVDLNDGGPGATCLGVALVPITAAALQTTCIRGGEQDIVTLGVNWYPNRNIRFMFNYMFVDVSRQAYPTNAGAGAGGPNAQVGQEYKAFALRTQYSF